MMGKRIRAKPRKRMPGEELERLNERQRVVPKVIKKEVAAKINKILSKVEMIDKATSAGVQAVLQKWPHLNVNKGDMIEMESALTSGKKSPKVRLLRPSQELLTRREIFDTFRDAANACWKAQGREGELFRSTPETLESIEDVFKISKKPKKP